MSVYTVKAPENSPRARFQEAVRTIRANGVKWYLNRPGCCSGCTSGKLDAYMKSKGIDPNTKPLGWTFKGQGDGTFWTADGQPAKEAYSKIYQKMVKSPVEEHELYINHSNGAGDIIADAFRLNGFEVDYDGNIAFCVIVKVRADKAEAEQQSYGDYLSDEPGQHGIPDGLSEQEYTTYVAST